MKNVIERWIDFRIIFIWNQAIDTGSFLYATSSKKNIGLRCNDECKKEFEVVWLDCDCQMQLNSSTPKCEIAKVVMCFQLYIWMNVTLA